MTLLPKQLIIGMPSGENVQALTISCLENLHQRHGNPFSAHLIGTYVERNQNLIVQTGLSFPTITHFMFIDSDMLFPPTIVEELLARNRDIVGCAYRSRQPPHEFMVYDLNNERPTKRDTGCKLVNAIPSGMMLVRRRVFETIPYPWFFNSYGTCPEEFVGNDVNFCHKAREAGFKIACDYYASRQIHHFGGCKIGWEGVG